MANNPQINVSASLKNIGNSTYKILPQYLKGFIRTPLSFASTFATMNDPTNATTAIQNLLKTAVGSRGYLIDDVATMENVSQAATYEDLPFGRLFVRDGYFAYRFLIDTGLPQFGALKSHHNSIIRAMTYDDNYLWGTRLTEAGTDYRGVKVKMTVEKFEGISDTTTNKVPVVIQLLENSEWTGAGRGLAVPVGFVSSLEKLTSVDLTIVGSPTSSTIVVKVQNSYDGVGIPGLVAADFTVTAGTIATSAESSTIPGQYTLTSTVPDFATGETNLVAASALSIDAYESTGAATYTI